MEYKLWTLQTETLVHVSHGLSKNGLGRYATEILLRIGLAFDSKNGHARGNLNPV